MHAFVNIFVVAVAAVAAAAAVLVAAVIVVLVVAAAVALSLVLALLLRVPTQKIPYLITKRDLGNFLIVPINSLGSVGPHFLRNSSLRFSPYLALRCLKARP